uniref:Uncharacterized protein n=1 Tax=Ciona savignyi TaxID=51511 RepID=H2YYQ1_CIOSA
MESMSLSKKEALSILLAFSDDSGGKTDTTSLSLTLARAGKSERRKHIRSSVGTPEQLISAALEISRTWRGYSCRKVLHDLFLGHDGRIQEKQIHAVKSETNPSSVMLSIHPVESSEQSLFNMAESVMSLPQEPGSVQELPAPTPAKVVRPKCRVISSKYDAAS